MKLSAALARIAEMPRAAEIMADTTPVSAHVAAAVVGKPVSM